MYNRSILVGRLTADPELKSTSSKISVTSFTVAVTRPYKVDDKEVADFIPCVAWRGTAEFVAKYFTKGKPIGVEGSLQRRTYEDKDGAKRWAAEIIVDRVFFVGDGKRDGGKPPMPDAPPPSGAANPSVGVVSPGSVPDGFEEMGDMGDLPF